MILHLFSIFQFKIVYIPDILDNTVSPLSSWVLEVLEWDRLSQNKIPMHK